MCPPTRPPPSPPPWAPRAPVGRPGGSGVNPRPAELSSRPCPRGGTRAALASSHAVAAVDCGAPAPVMKDLGCRAVSMSPPSLPRASLVRVGVVFVLRHNGSRDFRWDRWDGAGQGRTGSHLEVDGEGRAGSHPVPEVWVAERDRAVFFRTVRSTMWIIRV